MPPVASIVLVLSGYALAIARVASASKPFWSKFPGWLQHLLPAVLVGLGALPVALQGAEKFEHVLFAIVTAAGAGFTAWQGDGGPKDPPSGDSKPVGPKDPEPTRIRFDVPDSEMSAIPEREARAHGLLLASALLLLLSCSAPPAKPPCDAATLAAITARCSAQAFECGKNGGDEQTCTAACDAELDSRAKECAP